MRQVLFIMVLYVKDLVVFNFVWYWEHRSLHVYSYMEHKELWVISGTRYGDLGKTMGVDLLQTRFGIEHFGSNWTGIAKGNALRLLNFKVWGIILWMDFWFEIMLGCKASMSVIGEFDFQKWAKFCFYTSWVAIVTQTDRPKLVRNRCVIEVFGSVCVLSRCFGGGGGGFSGCRGFCYMTESDFFLFLPIESQTLTALKSLFKEMSKITAWSRCSGYQTSVKCKVR